jgi:uncharacterized membrane protein SpoIIM required for sporulation
VSPSISSSPARDRFSGDLDEFIHRRRLRWTRFEALLERVEASGLRSLPPDEVREFGRLYRRASSDLLTARARTANAEILDYLNDLVARGYSQVYRSRRISLALVPTFFCIDYPRLLRSMWKYTALAVVLLLVSAVAGAEMNRRDPAGAYYVLPAEMVKSLPVMQENWRNRTGHDIGHHEMAVVSSAIMTNNIWVGLLVFGGGLLLGLPTLVITLRTGLMVGILGEGMSRPDTALVFWSLILPHGILELFAICVMAGAGFSLAAALLAPGPRTRRDALTERGRPAVFAALGAAAMLVVSGLIEGFITPPAFIPPWFKLVFAAFTLVALALYVGFAGRGPQSGVLHGCYEQPRAAGGNR